MRLLYPLCIVLVFSINLQTSGQELSLSDEIGNIRSQSDIVGIGVAVVDENGIVFSDGFGSAGSTPYTDHTIQPIASISKTLLGLSLFKAQELGFLKIDDDINDYLPFELTNPHFPNDIITIRHLAAHRSGLKDTKHYEKAYVLTETIPISHSKLARQVRQFKKNVQMDLIEFIENVYSPDGDWYSKSNFHKVQVGEKYDYSNMGAAIASLVIEGATHQNYKEFVREHILIPLEMSDSGWNFEDLDEKLISSLFYEDAKIPRYELTTYADGRFITSVTDYGKLQSEVIKGYLGMPNMLLSADSFKEMLSRPFGSDEIGHFWVVGKKRIGHTGGDPGVTTVAYFRHSNAVGLILFCNTNSSNSVNGAMTEIFELLDERFL